MIAALSPNRRLTVSALVVGATVLLGCGGTGDPSRRSDAAAAATERQAGSPATPARRVLRKRTMVFTDRRRTVRRRDGRVEKRRRLVTVVRYPEYLDASGTRLARHFPLVVFAHGFALTPRSYRRLLHAWARAGYVVAAPVLPGENANAPGGPDRGDLLNQPADLRFVVAKLLAASASTRGPLAGAIDPAQVVAAGHSDGGNTALAVAYDPRYRSRRIDAAIILAGADLPGIAPFTFPSGGPPLLAVQGGADPINPPRDTYAFYDRAPAPKFLLTFPGAGHFGPYMAQRPQITALARVTTAFLDRTTKGAPVSDRRLRLLARRRGVSRLRVGDR